MCEKLLMNIEEWDYVGFHGKQMVMTSDFQWGMTSSPFGNKRVGVGLPG